MDKVINTTRRGLIVIGRLRQGQQEDVIRLATHLDWPVITDITSGLRLGNQLPNLIACSNPLLTSSQFKPDTILHIGGPMVSSKLKEVVVQNKEITYIHLTESSRLSELGDRITHRLSGSISELCRNFIESTTAQPDKRWKDQLTSYAKESQIKIDSFLTTLSELSIARDVTTLIPQNHGLFLSNSMPIREIDQFGVVDGNEVAVGTNRGVSGIDGIIATAAGFAHGQQKPTTLLIGDMAMLHDLNSLHIVKSIEQPLTIIVVNNRGGGIFSFLPIVDQKDIFETYFGTPHEYNFKSAADMFGISYKLPHTRDEFKEFYKLALQSNQSTIVEVNTDRDENRRLHNDISISLRNNRE